jgi:hypothetical protein
MKDVLVKYAGIKIRRVFDTLCVLVKGKCVLVN